MEYEIISILADKGAIGTIISAVKSIQFKNPDLQIGAPRYGQLSNKMIISYKVPKNQYKEIVSIFSMRDIPIITRDEEVLNIINSNKKLTSITFGPAVSESDQKVKKPAMSVTELEEFAKRGNYQEILKVSKDIINYGNDMVERARTVLTATVQVAMNSAYQNGINFQSKVDESIDALLKIASDQNLKTMNKTDLMRQAGFYAIEICQTHTKYIDRLIPICNNNAIPNIVNLMSAVKFSAVVFADTLKFADDLDIAVRNMNNKWLVIAADVSGGELSTDDKKNLDSLLEYIQIHR